MKRVLAITVILIALGYGYEKVSGQAIGVSRTMGWASVGLVGGFAGGYGLATGVAQGVFGGLK